MTKPRVVCLVGPTGVGKSAIALRLAGQFNGEIINADSRQVFEAFPIITAQPSQAEQSVLPHRLYGFLKTDARFSAGSISNTRHFLCLWEGRGYISGPFLTAL